MQLHNEDDDDNDDEYASVYLIVKEDNPPVENTYIFTRWATSLNLILTRPTLANFFAELG